MGDAVGTIIDPVERRDQSAKLRLSLTYEFIPHLDAWTRFAYLAHSIGQLYPIFFGWPLQVRKTQVAKKLLVAPSAQAVFTVRIVNVEELLAEAFRGRDELRLSLFRCLPKSVVLLAQLGC